MIGYCPFYLCQMIELAGFLINNTMKFSLCHPISKLTAELIYYYK